MSLLPIDLQTLFLRMSQVGQDQAAQRDSIIQGQDVAGREIAQRSRQHQLSVGEAQRVEEGPDAINEHDSGAQTESGEQGEQAADNAETKGTEEENVFQDPDLGRNIDISG